MKIELSTARQLRDCGLLDNMFDRPEALLELVRIGHKLHRLYENDCNGYMDINGNWDEKATARAEKRATKLETRAKVLATELGAFIYIQGDPRGATIYIDSKPIPDNNYNRSVCLV